MATNPFLEEARRRDALVGQIPTGGQRQAPAADGSQGNPFNTELGRNAMNTMAALPGATGLAARAGWTAGAARGAGGALSTERVIPAAWEVVQDGGAVAKAADSGGVLTRAANMAVQQPALAGNAPSMLPAIASNPLVRRAMGEVGEAAPQMARASRGPVPWADVVPPQALSAPQAGQALSGAASLNPLMRYAAMAAGAGGALTAATALDGQGGDAGAPVGAAQAAQIQRQGLAAAALSQPPVPSAATAANVIRDGSSYTGPANIAGDITVNGSAPRGSVTTLPAGATPSGFGGPLVQAAGIRPWGSDRPGFSIMDNPLVARALGNGPSAQNLGAADNLAAQGNIESMARLRASSQIASPGPGPSMSLSGGSLGFRRAPSIVASELGAQRGFDRAVGRDPASLQRAAALQQTLLEQQGANARQAMSSNATLGAAGLRASAGRAAPAGYRYTASGNLQAIPGGPADQEAKDASKPLNDVQAKALQFGARMQTASQNLEQLAGRGVDRPGDIKRAADAIGLGAAANWTQSPEQQQVEQSQRDYVNAVLRRESGAAIADHEFDNARKQYFPQIGDSPEVIAQKRRNREIATAGVLAEVPNAERRIGQVVGAASGPAAAAPAPAAARAVTRTGMIDGRRVAQYSDGSVEYAD